MYRKVGSATFAFLMLMAFLTASCGGGVTPTAAPGEEVLEPTVGQVVEEPQVTPAGGVDWQQFAGSRLSLLLIAHPFADVLQTLIPDFEAKTGIEVTMEVLPEVPANEKLLSDLSSGTGTYDLFMTDPMHNWTYATGGWEEPLDAYLADPTLTDAAAYDVADFIPGIWDAGKWNLIPMGGIGEGQLWAVPINYEAPLIAYRPSILQARGVEVPKTYEEVLDAAKSLTFKDENGQQIYGVVTRFDKYWDLPYLTFGTMLQSYGVEMIDAEGNLGICSPESIAATELFIKIIREASPEGAGTFTFYESMQGFASGQYAMAFLEYDGMVPVWEDPSQSQVTDDAGYALTPLGPDGQRLAALWVWEMGMNSASQNKGGAWLFLQWLTSKDTLVKTHLGGSMNPVRFSSWEDPEVAAMLEGRGEFPGQYHDVALEMAKVTGLRFPPHPELTRALDRWAEAIQQSYFDGGNVEQNLCAAQEEIATWLK